jgi:23S rRNA (cytosine1962-C5)-methyltransferase
MMNRDLKRVDLLPGREKRLLLGHRWVFSNEISGNASAFEPGSWVTIHSSRGVCLGSGYINPYSLIAVRLVCAPHEKPTPDFFRDLLEKAAMRRRTMFYPDSSCARMVYGEADGLPGLVVDCYGDVVVYQITTLGMALMEDLVKDLLLNIFRPKALVFRHDSPIRLLEGLPLGKGIAYGDLPDPCWIEVDGLEFVIDPLNGQKTGFYLDQRDNRRALRRWSRGKKVLDLFCYNGAWSLSAAAAGAREVVGVDQSPEAVAQARISAARNQLQNSCRFQEEEVFTFLKTLRKGPSTSSFWIPPPLPKPEGPRLRDRKSVV